MQCPTAVIFDLDGTIIDTESLCYKVGEVVVNKYGKTLTKEVARAAIGKRPLECWQVIVDALGIEATAQQLFDETEPLLQSRWHEARVLPGAQRLIRHLHAAGVPLAIATSTSRASFERKMATHHELRNLFQVVVCGDEVVNGKPSPDIFLMAAEKLGVDPKRCLALEDAPSGIEAAIAASMHVVGVPSIVDKTAYSHLGCTILPSLLEFQPSTFALPPFEDFIAGTVPLEDPWTIKGVVVKGFGRGSKELGIPTANISEDALGSSLADAVTGIYYGWASVGKSIDVHKMVMSVGYNPFYGNTHKTCEPWLLSEFDQDFYGEELRLVVCGYIRPEADFTTLEDLIQRIHKDASITREALQHPRLLALSAADYLNPLC